MKKVFVSMLALAALASCSSEEVLNEPVDGNKPVEIKLTAGVLSLQTKAPIENDGNSKFLPSIMGWEGTAKPTTGAPLWTTEPDAEITAGTSVPITLKDKQYYNADRTINTYICAFHPKGSVTADGLTTFPNTKGDVDVMLTDGLVDAGAKPTGSTLTPIALEFKHLLTQLKFTATGDASLAANTKVLKITVKGVKLPTGVNVFSGNLQVAADPINLDVDGVPTTTDIPTGSTLNLGNPIMVNPLTTTDLKLDIETTGGTFTDVPVTLDVSDNGTGGTSYGIALTFKQKEISVTATVAPWTSQAGSGTVE